MIFVSKAVARPLRYSPDPTLSIKPGWNGFPGTTSIAYLASLSVKEKKGLTTGELRRRRLQRRHPRRNRPKLQRPDSRLLPLVPRLANFDGGLRRFRHPGATVIK